MNTRINTLLLFSKLPEPGLVKTRLSVLKDGVFTAEDACEIYKSMLLDVVETCICALNILAYKCSPQNVEPEIVDSYELVISTAPSSNLEKMQSLITTEVSHLVGKDIQVRFIADKGKSFDEHYNDAFEQCWKSGSNCILSLGADMPSLTTTDITRGFQELHMLYDNNVKGIVLAPDQEMGVDIVGWNCDLNFNHTGVFYNTSGLTVLPAYINKARENKIATVYLPTVPDVDTIADLAHTLTLIDALDYCHASNPDAMPTYPYRTASILNELGISMVRIPPNSLVDPRDIIDEV